MYNLTLEGQGQRLTSDQGKLRSLGDPSRSKYTSFYAPCRDERNETNHTSLSCLDLKLLAKNCWWPRVTSMTFRGSATTNFTWSTNKYLIWCDSTHISLKCKTGSLIFAHWLIMGRSRKWPDLRSQISKIQDIHFVGTDDPIIFRKLHNFLSNTVDVTRL